MQGKEFYRILVFKKYIKRGKIWKYLVFACNPSHKQLKGKRQRQWVSVKINNSLDVNPLREHTQHTWPRPGLNSFDPRELGLVFGQISEPSYLAEDHLSKHSLPSCFYSLYISIFQFPIGIGDLPFRGPMRSVKGIRTLLSPRPDLSHRIPDLVCCRLCFRFHLSVCGNASWTMRNYETCFKSFTMIRGPIDSYRFAGIWH